MSHRREKSIDGGATETAYIHTHTSACACSAAFFMLEEFRRWIYLAVAQRNCARLKSHFMAKFKELSNAYFTFSLDFPVPLLSNMRVSWEG